VAQAHRGDSRGSEASTPRPASPSSPSARPDRPAARDGPAGSVRVGGPEPGGVAGRHAKAVTFQMAGVAVPRAFFAAILGRIGRARAAPSPGRSFIAGGGEWGGAEEDGNGPPWGTGAWPRDDSKWGV